MKKDKFPNTPVNLGLNELIGAVSKPEKKTAPAVETSPYKPEPDAVPTPPANEYLALADEGEWRKLREMCEARLAGTADAAVQNEARLWWAKCQLELHEMPLTVLAGPLESVGARLLEQGAENGEANTRSLRTQAATLLAEVSAGLNSQGEVDLGIACLERAYRLDPKYGDALRGLVGKRLADNVSLLKHKRYGTIAAKLRSLQSELGEVPKPPTREGTVPAGRVTLGNGLRVLVLLVLLFGLGGVAIWLSLGGGSLRFEIPQLFGGKKELPYEVSLPVVQQTVQAPEPERIEHVSELDAVLNDLKNLPRLALTQKVAQVTEPAQPKPTAPPKETINTTGPVESPELEASRRSPERVPADQTAGPQRDGFTPFEMPKSPQKKKQEESFEDFPVERWYSILAKTEIMPSASIRGIPMGVLLPGDRIAADRKEGYWLRIKSRQGRRGYILAQDAVAE